MSIEAFTVGGRHFYIAVQRKTGLPFFDLWKSDGTWTAKVGCFFFGRGDA